MVSLETSVRPPLTPLAHWHRHVFLAASFPESSTFLGCVCSCICLSDEIPDESSDLWASHDLQAHGVKRQISRPVRDVVASRNLSRLLAGARGAEVAVLRHAAAEGSAQAPAQQAQHADSQGEFLRNQC